MSASLLNTTTVQFSNWPISDGYITPLNVPASPSFVPSTSTMYPGNGLDFGKRVGNSISHAFVYIGRTMQQLNVRRLYSAMGYPNVCRCLKNINKKDFLKLNVDVLSKCVGTFMR